MWGVHRRDSVLARQGGSRTGVPRPIPDRVGFKASKHASTPWAASSSSIIAAKAPPTAPSNVPRRHLRHRQPAHRIAHHTLGPLGPKPAPRGRYQHGFFQPLHQTAATVQFGFFPYLGCQFCNSSTAWRKTFFCTQLFLGGFCCAANPFSAVRRAR